MIKKTQIELTEGSNYKILSIGGKNKTLETTGIFKGFTSLGIEGAALLMELDKKHGDLSGKIRILPLSVILAIDVIKAEPNRKNKDDKNTSHYA